MIDETGTTPDPTTSIIDETSSSSAWTTASTAPEPTSSTGSATPSPDPAAAVGFCQDCGTPLTQASGRRFGNSLFCEPCLSRHTVVPPPNPGPDVSGEPSPTVAGLLGLIPGVGAMYNGQVAKGFAHIIIFVVLVSLSDHVDGIFGIFIAGWVFYQVFDAVYTARARRDGLPLPNYFNLNNIGEHLQAHQHWQSHQHWQHGAPVPPAQPVPSAQSVPPAYASVDPSHHANWTGYIPPTAFPGNTPYANPYTAPQQPPTSVPYTPVSTPQPLPYAPPPLRRFPTAACILIVLGLFFLLSNLVPSFHISSSWVPAVVLIAATAFSLVKRIALAEAIRDTAGMSAPYLTLHIFRLPLILATLAVLFSVQAANISDFDHTWPVLVIVVGLLIFTDRLFQRGPAVLPMPMPPAQQHWNPATQQWTAAPQQQWNPATQQWTAAPQQQRTAASPQWTAAAPITPQPEAPAAEATTPAAETTATADPTNEVRHE